MKVAQRFNVGFDGPTEPVPKGGLSAAFRVHLRIGSSAIPSGLALSGPSYPVLKRGAIIDCPSGTRPNGT